MKVLMFGAGVIGTIYGYILAQVATVRFWMKSDWVN